MPEYDTPTPIRIRLALAAGDVAVRLTDTTVTRVQVGSGSDDAIDQTRVELRGDELVIEGPRRSGRFRSTPEVDVEIEAPTGSSLDAALQSADLETDGTLARARVRTGSGDVSLDRVTDELRVDSGSGDVRVAYAGGGGAVRSGSGDVEVAVSEGQLQCNTGSGDISLGRVTDGAAVRSGSGDVLVDESSAELAASTASGDQVVRRAHAGTLRLKSASGDVRVGVAGGAAAWLDINTVSGSVQSSLDESAEPGADEVRVAVHVSTVSGDVDLCRS